MLDKETGKSLPIQVKSWMLNPDKPVTRVQFDVQKTTFGKEKHGAVVCVVLEMETLAIETSWMIPAFDIPKVATDRPNKFAIVPSRLGGSKDKYTAYRHKTNASLTRAVEALLEGSISGNG